MARLTFRNAIYRALEQSLMHDGRVVVMGQDIGTYGGAFKVTRGLWERFGPDRVIETPISENGMAGVAVGAALTGLRPVLEFMFMDFMALAMDQICNHAAKFSYMYAGQCRVPVVFRAPFGGGFGYGVSHSQSLESWFLHVPGLKVVVPSTPASAYGLLTAAIQDEGPVVFLEHKALYNLEGEVADDAAALPIGRAAYVRRGADVTVACYGRTVWLAVEAAKKVAPSIDVEIVDLRTLLPLDRSMLIQSVGKTRRLVIVEDDCLTGGVGAEVAAVATESVLLRAPTARVAGADVPMPCCQTLERAALPHAGRVVAAIEAQMGVDHEFADRNSQDRGQCDQSHRREVVGAHG